MCIDYPLLRCPHCDSILELRDWIEVRPEKYSASATCYHCDKVYIVGEAPSLALDTDGEIVFRNREKEVK